jgi:N-acetylmuramic acid 6-phosphate etherase
MRATNVKLKDRAERIVMTVTGVDRKVASQLLERAKGQAKVAMVMHFRKVDFEEATKILTACDGMPRKAIEGGQCGGEKR